MPELPNIVRERLKVSRPTADHLEADTLTAFAELALPESERAVVAEHLARCHDCRDVLALSVPATVILEPVRVPLPAWGGWLRAPVLRWGVVAAGLAVVAVTGLLQYQRGSWPRSSVAEIQRYETPASAAKAAPAGRAEGSAKFAPGAPSPLAEPANAVPAQESRVNAGSTIASNADTRFKKGAAGNETGMLSMSGTSNLAGPTAGLPLHGPGSRTAGRSLGGPINGSLPLFRKPAAPSADRVETQSQLIARNTADQAANRPVQYQARNQEVAAGVGGRAFMDVTVDKAKAPETTAVEVSAAAPLLETSSTAPTSPSGALTLLWAISASGGLLRSFDQGRTWASVDVNASFPVASQMVMVVPQSEKYLQTTADARLQAPNQAQINQSQVQSQAQKQSEPKALSKSRAANQKTAAASVSIPVFRAISAAGLEVWAGGSVGMLYHSVNGGEQWTRVFPSASGILLTGDITGIAFSDPQHGQITTSTQELWTTSDAGQTWQKR